MKNSIRGALWSALVFPGSGQIVLKHRKRGFLFASVSVSGVIVMIVTVVRTTWNSLECLALQGSEITPSIMSTVVFSSLEAVKKYILPLMLLWWLLGIIDAWLIGRKYPENRQP